MTDHSPSEAREWVVYRDITTRQVFTRIVASTREEALEAWQNGAGVLDDDREQKHTDIEAAPARDCSA